MTATSREKMYDAGKSRRVLQAEGRATSGDAHGRMIDRRYAARPKGSQRGEVIDTLSAIRSPHDILASPGGRGLMICRSRFSADRCRSDRPIEVSSSSKRLERRRVDADSRLGTSEALTRSRQERIRLPRPILEAPRSRTRRSARSARHSRSVAPSRQDQGGGTSTSRRRSSCDGEAVAPRCVMASARRASWRALVEEMSRRCR